MAILEIKKFKDPVLRKKCQEVKEITSEIEKLVFDMAETMKKYNGAGLAAPQVGISKRIIVVQPDLNGEIAGYINPRIIRKSLEKETDEEGCLSFPNVFIKIKRAKEVEIEAMDINGKKIRIKAEGLLARILQHEIDHLDTILFFDRLGLFEKLKFKLKKRI